MRRVLIVGARNGGLGQAIKAAFGSYSDEFEVETAGVSGDEDHRLDITKIDSEFVRFMADHEYHDVICTVGINRAMDKYPTPTEWMNHHWTVNCVAVMNLLRGWLHYGAVPFSGTRSFVAISSNSAHIARSNSMAYCASKAALSMSLRVAAREDAGKSVLIYGYEPGLIAGTPMTVDTEERFGPSQTRIPGQPEGLSASQVAAQIVANIRVRGRGMNGVLVRLDGGEQ